MVCRGVLVLLFLGLVAAAPNSKGNLLTRLSKATNNPNGLGIYDGKKTTIAKHNYLVSVKQYGIMYCAGAIISDSYVLTLADCFDQTIELDMKIVAGSKDGSHGTHYKVNAAIKHPQYNSDSKDYNFALLQIDGTFSWSSTVGNVSLPSDQPTINTVYTVAGWGDNSGPAPTPFYDDRSEVGLYEGTMKWIDNTTCKTVFADYTELTDRMGCLYNKGKTTLCEGDWGDAFVKGGQVYALMAAALPSNICTSSAPPVLASNVYSVLDWINSYVKP